ncbi:hypothetical protein A2875_01675 [Candidatus Gottesmanbacteria bacterium RIFCSPHIGHO2_01_FULL_46_14]|uniref:Uncharacterized protein n=2 Tax=Candidatus Gottesmaniibacteriota TaxID=1752720 RepID=A0A1F5ZMM5_9BACT|nr:MAG: hypothetical protein A2875_01675 [Candidatus Gottesmanbacteria bacterium RIFCSPHIGHO2_01_FULL_46_14]OGG28833.1 MAG: hypothetical protein A2971_02760 [Candidatus Gottesmanbacteria bacterium RIFCSPLOWO2_01_FULL_46_21]
MKKFLYVGVPIVAFILIVGQILIANELAGVRTNIHSLDTQIATLTDERDLLRQQVASASALTTVSAKAKLAGFIPPTKSSVLSLGDSAVAINQK